MTKLKIQKNIPLAPLTTFKIGGKAKYFYRAKNPEELIAAAQWAKEKKLAYRVFGGGSNLLFPDKNLAGLTIQSLGGQIKIDRLTVTAEAGVLLANLIKQTIAAGLGGLEKLTWIPGTVGGAITGNAGAYGRSISDIVQKIEIWDGQKRRWLSKKECQFEYRHSLFKEKPYLILQTKLKLKRASPKILKNISRVILQERKEKFGSNLSCPGCFFKNVLTKKVKTKNLALIDPKVIIDQKIPTGYLLDQVGAKEMSVGGATVADFHANFIINKDRASSADVKKLAQTLKRKVKDKFGIKLEEEVRYF